MQNFTTTKDAQIVDVNGLVNTESAQNAALQSGENIPSGTVLTFAEGSEITLAFVDGTEQRITGAPDETLATNDQISQQTSTLTSSQTLNGEAPDNVQADIDAIQASIESGDDIDLPDTAASGLTGNEGTDFVTLDRQGNELLAGAGYDTAELDNPPGAASVFVDPNENVNALPDAVDDSFGMDENTQLTGSLLDNDDLGNEATTVTGFDNVSANGAAVAVDTQGNFTYTPVTDFDGADTFTYTITDLDGDTSTATVTVNVANVNKLPDAVDDTFTVDENSALTGTLLGNDDLGDEATTVTGFDDVSANGAAVTVDAQGNFTYVPVTDFDGADTFTYTITDADGDTSTATVTVNVTNVNKLPDAVDDTFTVDENSALTGTLLGNDDLGDEATTVTGFDDVSVNGAAVTVDAQGNFTYTPITDFDGADTFTYTITDADGDESTATVTVNVENVNKLPDAVDDSFEMDENTQLTGILLGNDDLGDEATTVTEFDNTSVNGAKVTVDAAGNFVYTPVTDFIGEDTFTYTITDVGGDESTATVTVDVANVNKLPDAVDDSFVINENTTLNNNVIGNDELGDPLTTVTPFDITAASGRTVSMDANGNFTYTPTPNFTGTDTFNYTITDADGDTSTATVTVIVEDVPVNLLPNAVDDSFAINENTTLNNNVLGNDNLGDPATTVTPFDITAASGRTVSMDANGNFTYTPTPNFTGTDTFNYTITDADGDTSTATVTVIVEDVPVNLLPNAVDDSFEINENTTLNNNVLGNDNLGDPATTVTPFDITAASGRTVSMDANGNFSYSPAPNFTGTDTFNYTITDSDGDPSTATVTVNVNDLPEAVDDTFDMVEGTTLSGNIIGNDDQGDGPATVTHIKGGSVTFDAADDDYATFTIIDGVYTAVSSTDVLVFDGATDNGILRINAVGEFTYENKGFLKGSSAPTFEYTLSDTDTAEVTINVNTNAPVANDDENGFKFNPDKSGSVEGNVTGLWFYSSTDVVDDFGSNGSGSPAVTQVVYQGAVHLLDASNTSVNPIKISTVYGDLSIDNLGTYTFAQNTELTLDDITKDGIPKNIDGNLVIEFTYTIQDGDLLNSEISSANLVIEIEAPPAQGALSKNVEVSFDETSGLIDTDFDAKALINVEDPASKYSPDLDDLSDILTDEHAGGLENYLAVMSKDDGAISEDAVVLEKGEADLEPESFTTVTNGLLADGAILISDATASNAPIAELDSAELL
jgi:hypothetical protein